MTLEQKITRVAMVLVSLITLGGFILSYAALLSIAQNNGISNFLLSLIWPLLIDFALLVFSIAVVRSYLLKEPAWWPWSLVAIFTFWTIVFNVVHVSDGVTQIRLLWVVPISLKYLVAIVPPLALVLSFESLMGMFRGHIKREGLTRSLAELKGETDKKRQELGQMIADKQAIIDGLMGQADNLNREIETLQAKQMSYQQDIEARREELKRLDGGQFRVYLPDNLSVEQRQSIVAQMDNDRLTIGQMAEALGVSEGTIKNDKRAMRESPNGQHKEI